MEDYAANRKGKQPGTGGMFGTTPAATQSAEFNVGAIPANTGSRKSRIYSDFFYELHHVIQMCLDLLIVICIFPSHMIM
jgi:hypothetical protein